MSTNQPVWELLANLGDAHPLDHGGYFIMQDLTKVYPPEGIYLIITDYPESENEDAASDLPYAIVHRFILDRCHLTIHGTCGDNEFHPNKTAWFDKSAADILARPQDSKGLPEVADYADVPDIRTDLCSDDICARARAYEAIGMYYGFDNLDSYPLHFTTRAELKQYFAEHVYQTKAIGEDA